MSPLFGGSRPLFFRKFSLFTLMLSSAILILTCQQKKSESDTEGYAIETAKMVSAVTSGYVSADDSIWVQFVRPMVKSGQVDVSMGKNVFEFSPDIDGVTRWVNRRTLTFKPNQPLEMRAEYHGTLDLEALLPEYAEQKLKPLHFDFTVTGREIAAIDGKLQPVDPDNPRKLVYAGAVDFTMETDLSDVQRAVQLTMNDRDLPVSIDGEESSTSFRFRSDIITRDNTIKEFEFTIHDGPLRLSRKYSRTFELAPLEEMKVMDISKAGEGQNARLEITFSDDLDPKQDIAGFITIDGLSEFSLKASGNTVVLEGDFEFSKEYRIKVHKGVRSRWGTKTSEIYAEDFKFTDLNPEMRFSSDGAFLPSANNQTLRFMTINLKKVELRIQRVFESNLGQFLQTERLESSKTRNADFNRHEMNRVGVEVVRKDIIIGDTRNTWLQHELDLSELFQPEDKGLYIVSLDFDQKDMLYGPLENLDENDRRRYYRGSDYYTNPISPGYVRRHGNIFKPLIISDIGLTYKKSGDRHLVWATDIISSKPLEDATVRLRTYQDQIITSAVTNNKGYAEFNDLGENVFYIEAEHGVHRSVIKLNEMRWNLSTFDTGGEQPGSSGIRAFIYTDRGVYRPGDDIHLSAIVRNQENNFPDQHPVTMELRNPKRQMVMKETNTEGMDGLYTFNFATESSAPTGNWSVTLIAGSKRFHHTLKIETVVPYKLKVELIPQSEMLTARDQELNLALHSTYLFGAPASELKADVSISLHHYQKRFDRFSEFYFSNQRTDFETTRATIFDGKLNSQGEAVISWDLPSLKDVPSALRATLIATVYEKGGRPNKKFETLSIEPYTRYVGIKRPDMRWGYAPLGDSLEFQTMLVSSTGQPISGSELSYRVYHNRRHWWWEYDSWKQYRLKFKSDVSTELMAEGTLQSVEHPVPLMFLPEKRGQYFLEVRDASGGHVAGIFFRAYPWGSALPGDESANVLALQADKESYNPGDEATVTFPAPLEGHVLVSIEQGSKVLDTRWYELGGDEPQMQVDIPITGSMAPNIYVSVSIIQPHSQSANDRPLRMYGVLPIFVENPETRRNVSINMPNELKSGEPFSVEIQAERKERTQFTIAVVDEGLLALTDFKTSQPWEYFFQKTRLDVNTYDLFGYVLGAQQGDIFKTFSIGGDMADYRESQLERERKKRFKPMALFKGPLNTNKNGYAKVDFEMPEYIGAVRVMVVAVKEHSYGHADKTVPVKEDLMVMPSLPRVIGPGDKSEISVSVFTMNDSVTSARVTMDVDGPLSIIGSANRTVRFDKDREQEVIFTMQADSAVGQGTVVIRAESQKFSAENTTNLNVRASSPRIYDTNEKTIKAGESVTFRVPADGLDGTNNATISIQQRSNYHFLHRVRWLIRYPYGCIEQTVSAVFPQLLLKEFVKDMYLNPETAEDAITENINTGIRRLQRRFAQPSGGFSYWPHSSHISEWGTNYAGHFLVEARKLGYHVPLDMMADWRRYLTSQARARKGGLLTQTYRLYLLALAGEPQLGPMNLLKENELKNMDNPERWLLAGAYKLAGSDDAAGDILKSAGLEVRDYQEFGNTYGSTKRDMAIILEMLVLFERWEEADTLAKEIAIQLSGHHWYSTQSTGYMLLALGKYNRTRMADGGERPRLVGKFTLPDGQSVPFDSEEFSVAQPIQTGFGKEVTVTLDKRSTLTRAYTSLEWNGIPLKGPDRAKSEHIKLYVEWLDEDGMTINPKTLPQGKAFWAHFRVSNPERIRDLDEIALVQVLPAGWEVDNTRLSGEREPDWMSNWRLNRHEYLDIRDDRVMWFFDLPSYYDNTYLDFAVKLTAVTPGTYTLPPTITEAMYNNDFQAMVPGGTITVEDR